MNSRKGALGTGLLYFIYFLMMVMILAGIYGGLIAYFGSGYPFRQTEANMMLEKTRECFENEGFFDLTTEISKDVFLNKCGFSSKVLEDGEHFIYVKNRNGIEFSIGVTDFMVRCFFKESIKNNDMPLCEPYGENNQGKNYILAGSSQNSRRVAI